jgi:CRISPR system Cascade subunit CasA
MHHLPLWWAAARCAAILAVPLGVAGCASYHAAPLAPAAIARSYQSRSLDAAAVAAEIKRIAPAAQWNGEALDRLSLLAAALRANPTVAEARAHTVSLEAATRAAKAGPPLSLTLTAEYARNAPESSPWLYGVTSDVPLDIGGRRSSRIDAANLAAVGARYDYAETVWTVRMTIRRALTEAMLAAREVEIGQALMQVRVRQLMALERRVAAGEAIRSDLERVRAEAAGDGRRVADAEARRLAAQAALAEALGVPPAELDKVVLLWNGFDTPPSTTASDVSQQREAALLGRADVLQALVTYDQAEADLRGEVARQWPELHLGPGYTWERGLVKLPFSLSFNLPPSDLNRGAIAAAEARRAEAGVHLEAVIVRGQAAIDAALIEQRAAHAALARVREVDVETAKRFASQADQELASGAIDRGDWAAAQVGFELAKLAEIDALRRVHAADAALEDALRRPLDGPELQIAPGILGEQR